MIVLPRVQAGLALVGKVTVCFVPVVRVNNALKFKPRVGHSERLKHYPGGPTVGRVVVDSWFECTLGFLLEDTLVSRRALTESGFTLEEFAAEWTSKDPEEAVEALDPDQPAFAITFHPDGSEAPRLLSSSGSSRGDERGYNTSNDDIDAGEGLDDTDLILIARRAGFRHSEVRQGIIDSLDLRHLKGMPGRDARAARRRAERGG